MAEYQQTRLGDDGPAEQRPLHLSARDLADGAAGRFGDARHLEQFDGPGSVAGGVAAGEALDGLQPGENRLRDGDGERTVEYGLLGQVADQRPAGPLREFGGEPDLAAVGNTAQNSLDQRGLSAAVGADDADEIPVGDGEIHMFQHPGAVVADADVVKRYQIHLRYSFERSQICDVMDSMLRTTSSASGSMATVSPPRSRAMISTLDAGNWLW